MPSSSQAEDEGAEDETAFGAAGVEAAEVDAAVAAAAGEAAAALARPTEGGGATGSAAAPLAEVPDWQLRPVPARSFFAPAPKAPPQVAQANGWAGAGEPKRRSGDTPKRRSAGATRTIVLRRPQSGVRRPAAAAVARQAGKAEAAARKEAQRNAAAEGQAVCEAAGDFGEAINDDEAEACDAVDEPSLAMDGYGDGGGAEGGVDDEEASAAVAAVEAFWQTGTFADMPTASGADTAAGAPPARPPAPTPSAQHARRAGQTAFRSAMDSVIVRGSKRSAAETADGAAEADRSAGAPKQPQQSGERRVFLGEGPVSREAGGRDSSGGSTHGGSSGSGGAMRKQFSPKAGVRAVVMRRRL